MSITRSVAMALLCAAALLGCGGGGGGAAAPDSGPPTGGSTPAPVVTSITAQPVDRSVQVGTVARFTVVASNASSYQWQSSADGVQWQAVAAADGAVLDVLATDLALNGMRYRVVVKGASASVTSQMVSLAVLAAPVQILTAPSPVAAYIGDMATFFCFATGTDLNVRWQVSVDGGVQWNTLPDASNATLVLPAVKLSDSGKLFRAVVSNAVGEMTSAAAALTVTSSSPAPKINTQPVDVSVVAGYAARFSTRSDSRAVLQWQASVDGGIKWSDVAGATNATLTLPVVSLADNGKRFRVVASAEGLSTISAVATLSVVAASTRDLAVLAGRLGGAGFADGQGMDARFDKPGWTATDGVGNVYVSMRCAVRKISPTGWVSTVAGSLECAVSDGAGWKGFADPTGMVVLSTGELIVAERSANTILRVALDGTVSTLAGSYNPSGGAADGVGSAASFRWPAGIARDGAGNLYVADEGNHTIRKITPAGVVSTYAGRAGMSGSVDGPASAALFDGPSGIAIDAGGVVYVAESSGVVRSISAQGMVRTEAGLGGARGNVDGVGSAARFGVLRGIAVGASGTLFVSDTSNQTVRKIEPGGIVSTMAGAGSLTGATDGVGASARFYEPAGVSLGVAGELYVADSWNNTVRKILPTWAVTTLAGKPPRSGRDDGTGAAASFNQPSGLAKDSQGNLYVADYGTGLVRKVTPAGVTSTYFTGVDAPFQTPASVKINAAGILYVADSSAHVVRRIASDGTMTVLAGEPGTRGYADGQGAAARFNSPQGLALDVQGSLYVSDGSNVIRKVTPQGLVTTFAGVPGSGGSVDGPAATARFGPLNGLAFDDAGNLYAAQGSCIRKVSANGMVSTFAGDCQVYGSTDGVGDKARFGMLWGLDIDALGYLYVADFVNHTVRKISPTGAVSTVLGTFGISSVVTGTSPLLNRPRGVLVLDATRIAVTSENAVLVYTMP